uniref:F-box and WD repeat domain containing 8 n=1 Tax=Poecilia reticulata TaxID=8081 RepID=A0A3P9NDZ0_POERE
MAANELVAFRERWKQELKTRKEETGLVCVPSSSSSSSSRDYPEQKDVKKPCDTQKQDESSCTEDEGSVSGGRFAVEADQPQYVSIARSLLDGRTSPLLDRIQEERTRRKRQYDNMTNMCSVSLQQQQQQRQPQRKVKKEEELVDQLIQDLNEVNDIPFFDIELPYELALKIFQYLNCMELGRCAQVSRAWRVLAEDGVLWFRLCQREGYHQGASVSSSPCWKSTLRDCRNSARTVRSNWKNRVGSVSQLQFELGKILCDVSSCDNFVLAGYTSGDVRLWDTLHWDSTSSFLKTNSLSANTHPRPHVSHVQINSTVAAASYEDGCVDLWSTETGGEPIHHYQIPGRIQALGLSPDRPVLVSAAGSDVRLDSANDCGYWRTVCETQLPKTVESLTFVPNRADQSPLVVLAAGEDVYLLNPQEEQPRTLHSVYGHPVTCLDASNTLTAFGVKRTGWAMHDGGNKIHVYSLETGKPTVCVGSSPGDFTCVNLRDSPPHLLVCGNKDRRVRVFDLRSSSSLVSLYAHHLGVASVQADDWKIVSGGDEGLVCVWEMRMGTKLWEMHNRHRGVISHYDFSEDALSQDHILPICRSDYIDSSGYNYNINLAVPYDRLAGSHPPL